MLAQVKLDTHQYKKYKKNGIITNYTTVMCFLSYHSEEEWNRISYLVIQYYGINH